MPPKTRGGSALKRKPFSIGILILTCLWGAGCNPRESTLSPATENPPPGASGPLRSFSTDSELESYLLNEFAEGILPEEALAEDSGAAGPASEGESNGDGSAAGGAGDSGAPSHSGTNNQETGVDESDQVKTDGTRFYIARDQSVSIVNAVPAETMAPVGTLDVPGVVDSLHLSENILVVLYTPVGGEGDPWVCMGGSGGEPSVEDGDAAAMGMPCYVPVRAQTGVLLADVSDPASPVLLKDAVLDGWLSSSRLIDRRLHVIQQFIPELPPLAYSYDGTEEGLKEAVEDNQEALDGITLEELVPLYEEHDAEGATVAEGRLVPTEEFYHPGEEGGGSIVTVTTFDLSDPGFPFSSVGIVADVQVVYASTDVLYLAATRWSGPSAGEGVVAAPAEDSSEYTVIHKLDLAGDPVVPLGSGAVPGRILNQFSLGEYEDVLRIATTTGQTWLEDAPLANHVFCLRFEEGELSVIGKIENLAPGEQIYSARFIGPRGFLVTFVQVDPLFTLDLSDPTAPRLAGELKVPGFSTYIHPLGENHLITIGRDPESNVGVQLSLFDVTDFGQPILVHKQEVAGEGAYSEALYNHKAFTFWADRGLLAIPVEEFNFSCLEIDCPVSPAVSGLHVYEVTPEVGFQSKGRIGTEGDPEADSWFYPLWTRGIFIDENVYAVTDRSIHSAALEDIENTIHSLDLES